MARAIMMQGTMSNVGKSVLSAALCRIFFQDGYRVAPFKSQNMALNSYVTTEGLEMGRAQVMQAEAAGLRPSVLMNPILLKPTDDRRSQLVVKGEVMGTMSAQDYFSYKKNLLPLILDSYAELASAVDIMVIEGAGSPAEINLKDNDIVNMGLAQALDVPVLLTGDIDRGGVFAQLIGTLVLLDRQERERVKGLLINKFRGDGNILRPGISMLEERSGVPVIGTIPYMRLSLDDEDSLSSRLECRQEQHICATDVLDIAVVQLPHIANFSDFTVLESLPGIGVRYVRTDDAFGAPDMLVLPGTKNTLADLQWLKESGLAATITTFAARGGFVLGICGGFQMLGHAVDDESGVEQGGSMEGLCLLPVRTAFLRHKKRSQCSGSVVGMGDDVLRSVAGMAVHGYEMHHGETHPVSESYRPFLTLRSASDGVQRNDGACLGNVCGTYLHGFFDCMETTRALLNAIAEKKGLAWRLPAVKPYRVQREEQYDLLAAQVRRHVDMSRIYGIMGLADDERNTEEEGTDGSL